MGTGLVVYLVLGDAIGMALSALMPYLPPWMHNRLALYMAVFAGSLPALFLFTLWARSGHRAFLSRAGAAGGEDTAACGGAAGGASSAVCADAAGSAGAAVCADAAGYAGAAGDRSFRAACGAPKRRMKPWQFFMTFVMTMGIAYLFNFLGMIINALISAAGGGNPMDMNPVYSAMDGMDPYMAAYVGILGPVVEEIVYRGAVLGTVRPFGDREAVIFSAVAFGLMHGNLSQALYATAIGMIFGFVTVRSGSIFYSCILHIMVNGYALLISLALQAAGAGPAFEILSAAVFLMILIFAAAGMIFLGILLYRGSLRLSSGAESMGESRFSVTAALFFNPGFGIFALVCMLSVARYLMAG